MSRERGIKDRVVWTIITKLFFFCFVFVFGVVLFCFVLLFVFVLLWMKMQQLSRIFHSDTQASRCCNKQTLKFKTRNLPNSWQFQNGTYSIIGKYPFSSPVSEHDFLLRCAMKFEMQQPVWVKAASSYSLSLHVAALKSADVRACGVLLGNC